MLVDKVIVVDKVETSSVIISLRSDRIMHLHILSKDEFSLKELKDSLEAYIQLGKGKKYANLVTFEEEYIPFSSEAKKFAASLEANKHTICDAIVVKSLAMRLAANVYLKLNKPVVPTRSFNSKEKAIEWLNTFL